MGTATHCFLHTSELPPGPSSSPAGHCLPIALSGMTAAPASSTMAVTAAPWVCACSPPDAWLPVGTAAPDSRGWLLCECTSPTSTIASDPMLPWDASDLCEVGPAWWSAAWGPLALGICAPTLVLVMSCSGRPVLTLLVPGWTDAGRSWGPVPGGGGAPGFTAAKLGALDALLVGMSGPPAPAPEGGLPDRACAGPDSVPA